MCFTWNISNEKLGNGDRMLCSCFPKLLMGQKNNSCECRVRARRFLTQHSYETEKKKWFPSIFFMYNDDAVDYDPSI